jgi:hypothetical protein
LPVDLIISSPTPPAGYWEKRFAHQKKEKKLIDSQEGKEKRTHSSRARTYSIF